MEKIIHEHAPWSSASSVASINNVSSKASGFKKMCRIFSQPLAAGTAFSYEFLLRWKITCYDNHHLVFFNMLKCDEETTPFQLQHLNTEREKQTKYPWRFDQLKTQKKARTTVKYSLLNNIYHPISLRPTQISNIPCESFFRTLKF